MTRSPLVGVGIVLAFLTFVAVIAPIAQGMPGAGLDGGWAFGMNVAVAHGWEIGRRVIFTFGPFAALYTRLYEPSLDGLMLSTGILLAFCYTACVASFARRPIAVLLLLFALTAMVQSLDPIFIIYFPLALLALIASVSAPYARRPAGFCRIAFIFLPFGIIPLIKGSFIAVEAVALLACVAYLSLRRLYLEGAIITATALTSIVIFWSLVGQHPAGLVDYFQSLMPIISGYTDAMSLEGEQSQVWILLCAEVLVISTVLNQRSLGVRERLALALVVLVALHTLFKAAVVRHDGHALIGADGVMLLALLVGLAGSFRFQFLALCAIFTAWYALTDYYDPIHLSNRAERIYVSYAQPAFRAAMARIGDPESLSHRYRAAIETLREQSHLPELNGTTDVYSNDQSDLIASGNTWNPRPVFQSYSAFTAELLTLNREHLLTAAAPDHLLLKPQAIDRRFPTLDDGASWDVFLDHYQTMALREGFVILDKRTSPATRPQENAVSTNVTARLGESVSVPAGDLVFASVDVRPTLLGRLLGIVYKSSPLEISVRLADKTSRSFRYVAGMGKTGFLMSPLVENAPEVAKLYSASDLLSGRHVRSFTITSVDQSHDLWASAYHVAFRVRSRPGDANVDELLGISRFEPLSGVGVVPTFGPCEASIDMVNGAPLTTSTSSNGALSLVGWIRVPAEMGTTVDEVYATLSDVDGRFFLAKGRKVPRIDVANYLKEPLLANAGYEIEATASDLHGDFRLGLAYVRDGSMRRCPRVDIAVALP